MSGEEASPEVELFSQMMEMVDTYARWIQVAKAYRERCIGEGFGPEAADSMAADFHRMLYRQQESE